MPPVQLSSLFGSSDEDMILYVKEVKSTFYDAIYKELGEDTFEACNIPSKEDILNATKSSPLPWNGADSFTCNDQIQSHDSFIEQHAAIEMCCQQINKYVNISDQSTFTKMLEFVDFLVVARLGAHYM